MSVAGTVHYLPFSQEAMHTADIPILPVLGKVLTNSSVADILHYSPFSRKAMPCTWPSHPPCRREQVLQDSSGPSKCQKNVFLLPELNQCCKALFTTYRLASRCAGTGRLACRRPLDVGCGESAVPLGVSEGKHAAIPCRGSTGKGGSPGPRCVRLHHPQGHMGPCESPMPLFTPCMAEPS
jgi:hypothetical protein